MKQGHATCLKFNPNDLCVAVGTSMKQVKYWELQEYTLVSASTHQDYVPRRIEFTSQADGVALVAYDDCTRVLKLDEDSGKPLLLDMLVQPFKEVLDMRIS